VWEVDGNLSLIDFGESGVREYAQFKFVRSSIDCNIRSARPQTQKNIGVNVPDPLAILGPLGTEINICVNGSNRHQGNIPRAKWSAKPVPDFY